MSMIISSIKIRASYTENSVTGKSEAAFFAAVFISDSGSLHAAGTIAMTCRPLE